MRSEFDVIIVGAGPAGSAAAILLAQAGWSVALIEKQDFPRRKVCGECIAASNLPLLDALGIGPAFALAAGPELRKIAFMQGEQQVVAELPAATHQQYLWGRALGRETLDTLLLEQARCVGAQVLQPWSMQAIKGRPGHWHCQVRAVATEASLSLRTALIIDAHGSWQALPSAAPIRHRRHRGSDLLAFKANFGDAALEEGLLPVLSFDGGYGGMVLADGGLTTVACCIRRDQLEICRRASPGLNAGEVVEAMLKRQCAGVRMALQGADRVGPWLATGPLDPGIRLRADDDLLRIGNAAGEAHPIIGEGMSMALQSAWLLCAHLLAGERAGKSCDEAWQGVVGRRYALEWRRQFAPRLRLAAAFAHLAMRPRSTALVLALARTWPGLLTLGANWCGKARCAVAPTTITMLTTPAGVMSAGKPSVS